MAMPRHQRSPSPRPQGRPTAPRRVAPSTRRPLPRNPGSFRPAMRPSPMNVAKRRAAGAVLGKAAARFVPGLGLALLLYDIYEALGGVNPKASLHHENPTCPSDGGFWFLSLSSVSGTHTPPCGPGAVTVAPGTDTVTTTAFQNYVAVFNKSTAAANRRWQHQCWGPYEAGTQVTFTESTPGLVPARDPKAWEIPEPQPWLDPSLPPQFQPRAKRPRPTPWLPDVADPTAPPTQPAPYPYEVAPQPVQWPKPRRFRWPRRRRYRPPRTQPRTRPRLPPGMDPFPRPVRPIPEPITDPPPWPGPQPSPGPAPRPAPGPQPTPAPPPAAATMPGGWQVIVRPRPRTRARLRPRRPNDRPVRPPPGRGNRETKLGANRAGFGWLTWLFNFATEADDYIGSIAKALPCSVQRKLPKDTNIPQTLAVLMDHWDEIDWNAAMSELLLNQVEDYIIGRTRAAVSKGFGTEKNWYNYWKMLQAEDLTEFGSAIGKNVNSILDEVADRAGLHRVRCRKR